ncbi:MAG: hypothetical protein FWG73_06660 [Planctomycetaceae bacterium]|nr:hypothetical protein [Planctomycetaceae bacterium]
MITAIATIVIALWQWEQRRKIRRAEFVKELVEKLRFDDELAEAGRIIDHDLQNTTFTADFYKDKKNELRIDKYLAYLSYLCYLIEAKLITDNETQLFGYKIVRVLESSLVKGYLWNLMRFSEVRLGVKCSFHNLITYGMKHGRIDKDFMTNRNKFPKVLNF